MPTRGPARPPVRPGPPLPPRRPGGRARPVARPIAHHLARLALLGALLLPGAARADLDVADVRPGQRGFAVTAGAGGALERFPVEVLGVLDDGGEGFPLVLVRAEGPFIAAAGGVAAGMSGSPVRLETPDGGDDLLGAIGFVFPESDLSLALVTPIAAMRSGARRAALPEGAAPVATPLLVSGLSPRAASLLEGAFAGSPVSLLPVQAGGGGADGAPPAGWRLEPGAAVAVQLARGDASIAAVGTVTTVEPDGNGGGEVLAFGHPLLARGAVDLPLAPAEVIAIVPSRVVPFKLANVAGDAVAAVRQDRPAAIAARIGAEAAMLPVRASLGGEGGEREVRFEVVRDESIAPALVAASMLDALDATLGRRGPGSARLAWEIVLEDGREVHVLDGLSTGGDLALEAARRIGAPLAVLSLSPFPGPRPVSLSLRVDLSSERDEADLIDAEPDPAPVPPGGTATAYVRVQPWRAEPLVRTLRFDLPEGLEPDAEGEVEVVVRGGAEPRPGLGEAGGAEEPPLLSYEDLLIALRDDPQATEIVVEAVVDGEWVRLGRQDAPWPVRGLRRVRIPVAPPIPDAAGGAPDAEPAPGAPEPLPPGEGAPDAPRPSPPEPDPPAPPVDEGASDAGARRAPAGAPAGAPAEGAP